MIKKLYNITVAIGYWQSPSCYKLASVLFKSIIQPCVTITTTTYHSLNLSAELVKKTVDVFHCLHLLYSSLTEHMAHQYPVMICLREYQMVTMTTCRWLELIIWSTRQSTACSRDTLKLCCCSDDCKLTTLSSYALHRELVSSKWNINMTILPYTKIFGRRIF